MRLIKFIKNLIRWWEIIVKDDNHHYGFILFSINHKLKIMKNNWVSYSGSEDQLAELNYLIKTGDSLIKLLTEEEKINHIRSKEYLDLNKKYFDGLKKFNIDIYY